MTPKTAQGPGARPDDAPSEGADAATPEDVERLFTRSDGSYVFARWGRPLVPVLFGLDDASLAVFKGALEAVVARAGHRMAETDPELGANSMFFFLREWEELSETPNLDRLVPDLGALVARLRAAEAAQYRFFRFDDTGAIKASFSFLRMRGALAQTPADTLALHEAVQSMLLWSDRAFTRSSPLAARPGGVAVVKPFVGTLLQAAYDPVMPPAAADRSHALRLFARLGAAA